MRNSSRLFKGFNWSWVGECFTLNWIELSELNRNFERVERCMWHVEIRIYGVYTICAYKSGTWFSIGYLVLTGNSRIYQCSAVNINTKKHIKLYVLTLWKYWWNLYDEGTSLVWWGIFSASFSLDYARYIVGRILFQKN